MSNMPELKPCPFCGGEAYICGAEVTDYYMGTWAPKSRKEYWVQTHCSPTCLWGMVRSRAFGTIGGVRYGSEMNAARVWNRRAEEAE